MPYFLAILTIWLGIVAAWVVWAVAETPGW